MIINGLSVNALLKQYLALISLRNSLRYLPGHFLRCTTIIQNMDDENNSNPFMGTSTHRDQREGSSKRRKKESDQLFNIHKSDVRDIVHQKLEGK